MKTKTLLLLAALGLAGATASAQTAFTPGNLVVNRLGDGTNVLSSASTNITIQEFTPSGTFVQGIAIPGTGTGAVTDSGTATANGYINTFGNTTFVPGYQTPVGTASVTGTTSTAVRRALVQIGDNGVIGAASTAGTGWTGNSFRSAIGVNGMLFGSGTASGTNSGVRYFDGPDSSIRISSPITNVRNLEVYGNELMFSTASGTTGIYSLGAVSSLDLTSADQNTATLLIPTASPYGFFMDLTNGVAFVAGDGGTNTGGISRWDYDTNSTTWVQTWLYRLNTVNNTFSSTNSGGNITTARGLTGFFDEDTQTYSIFATDSQTSNNQLIGFTDGLVTSVTAGSTYDVVASAGANYVFRGVDFAAIPEPGTLALVGLSGVLLIYRLRRKKQ